MNVAAPPFHLAGEHGAQLGHRVARDDTCLDGCSQLPTMARLLPVVAVHTCAPELLDRHLRLARSVGPHERHVLTGTQGPGRKEDGLSRCHGDDLVARQRLLERLGHGRAELLRDDAPALRVDVPEEGRTASLDEQPCGLRAVDAAADDRDRRRIRASERVHRDHAGCCRAQRGDGRRVEDGFELTGLGVREEHEPGHGR
jgi:hypothetical protein